eukprot:jgi/Ulvmu1/1072/UM105_0031.1
MDTGEDCDVHSTQHARLPVPQANGPAVGLQKAAGQSGSGAGPSGAGPGNRMHAAAAQMQPRARASREATGAPRVWRPPWMREPTPKPQAAPASASQQGATAQASAAASAAAAATVAVPATPTQPPACQTSDAVTAANPARASVPSDSRADGPTLQGSMATNAVLPERSGMVDSASRREAGGCGVQARSCGAAVPCGTERAVQDVLGGGCAMVRPRGAGNSQHTQQAQHAHQAQHAQQAQQHAGQEGQEGVTGEEGSMDEEQVWGERVAELTRVRHRLRRLSRKGCRDVDESIHARLLRSRMFRVLGHGRRARGDASHKVATSAQRQPVPPATAQGAGATTAAVANATLRRPAVAPAAVGAAASTAHATPSCPPHPIVAAQAPASAPPAAAGNACAPPAAPTAAPAVRAAAAAPAQNPTAAATAAAQPLAKAAAAAASAARTARAVKTESQQRGGDSKQRREVHALLRDELDEPASKRRKAGRRMRCPTASGAAPPGACRWAPYKSHSELPTVADIPEDAEHLVVDGAHAGSVTRFFNHSCCPNVVSQTVLLPGAGSALLYGVALFAAADVAAMTELRWNYYGHTAGEMSEGSVRCLCGSTPCRKWLY